MKPTVGLRVRRLVYRAGYPLVSAWWLIRWLTTGRGPRGAKCLLTSEGEILLVRHTYGHRGRWDLPGGLAGRGEEPLAAARRELDEELGVSAELHEVASLQLRIRGRRDRVHLFAGELTDRDLRPNGAEIADVAWFTASTLPTGIEAQIHEAIVVAAEESRLAASDRR